MKFKIYNFIYIILFILAGALILFLTINLQFKNNNEESILLISLGLAVDVILLFVESYFYIRGFNKEAALLPIICFKEGSAHKINWWTFTLYVIVGIAGLIFSIIFGLQILNIYDFIKLGLADNYFFFSIALTLLINCSAALIYQILYQQEKI